VLPKGYGIEQPQSTVAGVVSEITYDVKKLDENYFAEDM